MGLTCRRARGVWGGGGGETPIASVQARHAGDSVTLVNRELEDVDAAGHFSRRDRDSARAYRDSVELDDGRGRGRGADGDGGRADDGRCGDGGFDSPSGVTFFPAPARASIVAPTPTICNVFTAAAASTHGALPVVTWVTPDAHVHVFTHRKVVVLVERRVK